MVRALALAALLVFLSGAAQADETLRLNTGTRQPYTSNDRTGFLDLLIAEAFRRAGRKAEVAVYEASKRALINANDGVDAGAAMRIKTLNETYRNLIRVPEKVIDNDFVAYTLSEPFPTEDWRSLAPYVVGHIIAWKVFERNLAGARLVTTVRGVDQLFSLLRNKRVDVILYERWQGLWHARSLGLDLQVLDPPLAKRDMYMFLHERHAALVAPVAEALRAMKADGTYRAIVERTLAPLSEAASETIR